MGPPPSQPAKEYARGTPTTLRLHQSACSRAAQQALVVRRRRQRCCQRGRKPAVSARRLPRQQPGQTRPSSTQLTPRGIQTESLVSIQVSSISQDQEPCSSPLGPCPFSRNAVSHVSPSSSPRNGPSTRPSTSDTRSRVLRSITRSTCLRSTRPLSWNPLSTWKRMAWRIKTTMTRPSTSTGTCLEAPFMTRNHLALECQ